MSFRLIAATASLVLLSAHAIAWSDLESMKLTSALANVLASEEFCSLSYKQDAIRKFIDTKVPADDMEFAGSLNVSTVGVAYQLRSMSESAKTAHCRQIERIAKSYGFV